MKQALQALLIGTDPTVRLAIMLGKKKITIRAGHRDYKVGPVMLCCHITPWTVLTSITSVRLTTLAEVTQEEMNADGYECQKCMLEDLQTFYPELTMDSPVTVITWGELDKECYFANYDNIKYFADLCGIGELFEELSDN